MPECWAEIGSVCAVSPGARQVVVTPCPGWADWLCQTPWLVLRTPPGHPMRCKITAVSVQTRGVRMTLSPGVSRDQVASLKGLAVLAPADVSPYGDGALNPLEWVGFEVITDTDERLGVVADAYWTPAHGVFEVILMDGGTLAMPAVEEAVKEVDQPGRRVRVNRPAQYGVVTGGHASVECDCGGVRHED